MVQMKAIERAFEAMSHIAKYEIEQFTAEEEREGRAAFLRMSGAKQVTTYRVTKADAGATHEFYCVAYLKEELRFETDEQIAAQLVEVSDFRV